MAVLCFSSTLYLSLCVVPVLVLVKDFLYPLGICKLSSGSFKVVDSIVKVLTAV